MCKNNCATRCLPKVWHPERADLNKKSAQTWCDLHPMGRISEWEEADQNHNQSCTPNHWPLWSMENLKLYLMVILVATNGHWHRSLLQVMWKVPDQQKQHAETTRVSTQLANIRQAMAVGGHGLHGTITLVPRQWLPVELTVTPVRFTPGCTPMLLFDSLGCTIFHFAIGCHRCEVPLIELLCNKLSSSLLLQ